MHRTPGSRLSWLFMLVLIFVTPWSQAVSPQYPPEGKVLGGGCFATPANGLPYNPNTPSPVDNATAVDSSVTLQWAGGDPDVTDTVTYDVYFDAGNTNPTTLICDNTSSTSCVPGSLDYSKIYYWKVVATDCQGESNAASTVWKFTTAPPPNKAPNIPGNPTPISGASGVEPTTDLQWSGGDPDGDSVLYTVYAKAGSPPSATPQDQVCQVSSTQNALSCNPPDFLFTSTYHWKVLAHDGVLSREGPVWTFTTLAAPNDPANVPVSPVPAHNSNGIPVSANLQWTGGDPENDQVAYKVYLRKNFEPTETIAYLVCNFTSAQSSLSCDPPGSFDNESTYLWKVVAQSLGGDTSIRKSSTWSFTTIAPDNQPPNPPEFVTPSNNAAGVFLEAVLQWTGSDPDPGDTLSYDVFLRAGAAAFGSPVCANVTVTTCDPVLLLGKNYEWKVIARDNKGATRSSQTWRFDTESAPYLPSGPNPSDGRTSISVSLGQLQWSGGDPDPGNTVSYDVYFGTNPGNLGSPKCNDTTAVNCPIGGGLAFSTRYYWRVIAQDNRGNVSNGPTWDFTTRTDDSAPDLTVNQPMVTPEQIGPGLPLTISTSVLNGGTNATPSSTTLRMYLSSDALISTADDQLGTVSIGVLAAGADQDASINFPAPDLGTYYIGACVDPVAGESSVSNNCSTGVQITVQNIACLTAEFLGLNSTRDRNITAGVKEYFRLETHTRGRLLMYSTGETGTIDDTDTYGTLRDSDCQAFFSSDDDGEFLNFLMQQELNAGTYFLEVRGYDQLVTGPYQLHTEFDIIDPPPAPGSIVASDDLYTDKTVVEWSRFALRGSGGFHTNVGYYDATDEGATVYDAAARIRAAGGLPVPIDTPDAASLAGLSVFVVFVDNSGFSPEWTTFQGDIQAAVENGMVLLVHDRAVGFSAQFIPGGSEISFVPFTENDLTMRNPGSTITHGPNGVIGDATLDAGNWSSHGYADLASLPAGSVAWMAQQVAPDNIVAFEYPLGSGGVIYSGVPLDYYIENPGTGFEFSDVYAPNVIAHAQDVASTWYEVYRCTTTTTDSCGSPIASLQGAGNTRYEDKSGQPKVVYYYRVKACTTPGGCSDFSGFDAGSRPGLPPTVMTVAPLDSGTNWATFSGTVNPRGEPTEAWFEYGLDDGFGFETTHVNIGSVDSAMPFDWYQDGLLCESAYLFRLVAQSAAGISYGEIFAAYTTECPDLHGESCATATAIGVNSTTHGFITGDILFFPNVSSRGADTIDHDFFEIQTFAPGTLTVETRGQIDTFGFLKNSACSDISIDDDSGDGLNFRMVTPLAQGSYFVDVRGYDQYVSGHYDLESSFLATFPPGTPSSPLATQGAFPDKTQLSWDRYLQRGSGGLPGVVGYYDATGQGVPQYDVAIAINAAHGVPVAVETPDAGALAALDVLLVFVNNDGYGPEWSANLTAISNAVENGLTLVVHDRNIGNAAGQVPGGGSISFFTDFTNDLQIPDFGSTLNYGPGGALDNDTLDSGTSSSHGYATAASLPGNSRIHIAHQFAPGNAVTFEYPLGLGTVIYSGIPLDYYLFAFGLPEFSKQYAPNIIAYALDISQSYYEIYRCTLPGDIGSCGSPIAVIGVNVPGWSDFGGKKDVEFYYRRRACNTVAGCGGLSADYPGHRGELPMFSDSFEGEAVGDLSFQFKFEGGGAQVDGCIVVRSDLFPASGEAYLETPDIVSLKLDYSDPVTGVLNFGLQDYSAITFQTGGAMLDLGSELVGQPTLGPSWGTSPSNGEAGDFNLFSNGGGAPNGTWYFTLSANVGAFGPVDMYLTSMKPGQCP